MNVVPHSFQCTNTINKIQTTNNGEGFGKALQPLHSPKTTNNSLIIKHSDVTFEPLQSITK